MTNVAQYGSEIYEYESIQTRRITDKHDTFGWMIAAGVWQSHPGDPATRVDFWVYKVVTFGDGDEPLFGDRSIVAREQPGTGLKHARRSEPTADLNAVDPEVYGSIGWDGAMHWYFQEYIALDGEELNTLLTALREVRVFAADLFRASLRTSDAKYTANAILGGAKF